MSARIIKAAGEETQAVKDKAYEQYTNQVALNNSLLGQKEEYTEEWLEQANSSRHWLIIKLPWIMLNKNMLMF